ncbi:MAG: P-type conjugative transfer protein TrbJ, partial [Arcobacteraceae bacterium]|nr:P-type conjugative transfer protein TrbJ [Arcobacteraceae bacterium]
MKRLTFSIATAILLSTTSASAGIPVIDVASIAQAVTNYSQMIKDYTLQLQQYEQMYSQLQQQLLMVEMQQRNLKRLTNYDFRDTRSILLNTRQIMTRVQTISYDAEGVARSFEKTYGDFEKYNNMLNEAQNEEEKAELFSNRYKEIAMINQNTIDGTLQKLEARYEELDNETYELTTLKNRSS